MRPEQLGFRNMKIILVFIFLLEKSVLEGNLIMSLLSSFLGYKK